MNRSGIEYLCNADGSPGYHWPVFTGCAHTLVECATAPTCWARTQAHRFHRSFAPAFHPEQLVRPDGEWMHLPRKSAHIGVAFGGDMFGDFNLTLFGEREWERMIGEILRWVCYADQHRFYFLTKAPQNLARFNPWPDNAWVGLTLTGAELPEQQSDKFGFLTQVRGGHRWLSYEPVLGQLMVAFALHISWLVIGAQSRAGAIKPKGWWISEAEAEAFRYGLKVWRKRNLLKAIPGLEPRQERP